MGAPQSAQQRASMPSPVPCTRVGKVREALKPGGRAVTLEFIPKDDRVSPPEAAGFSLTMLAGTETGDAYTYAEYDRMFRNAGFTSTELRELPQMPQRVVISHK